MKYFYLIFIMVFAEANAASFDLYDFDSLEQEKRFRHMTAELRCPKCQNQSIADSDAALSMDLKKIVYEMIKTGSSDQDIRDFMRKRYGDFVLYRPPMEPKNYVLYFGPFIVLMIALVGIAFFVRGQRKKKQSQLDSAEQERLSKLMNEIEGDES